MLNEALAYAERGWRVFPCIPKDKKPLIKEWQLKATTDTDQIKAWWEESPEANIGIATGEESGFFVLDVDGERGAQSLMALEEEIGEIPETLEAKTGTGGRHIIMEMPDREVRNKQNFRPGLDIRGEGGYIIAAPSIHPNGNRYEWPFEWDDPIEESPEALLDIICPLEEELPVQEPVTLTPAGPARHHGTPVTERATLYLQECEAATQSSGGHDALLWAARALVVGFEMSRDDALSLLWNDFNVRCSPPWNRAKPADVKDFERKVDEALRTPGQKPRGWLLDECGLRSDDEALQSMGRSMAQDVLASEAPESCKPSAEHQKFVTPLPAADIPVVPINAIKPKFVPFPIDCFPLKSADYIRQASKAHVVDPSFIGLPMLVVAATAIGNVFRVKLKEGFDVPPTLWGGVVAASGENKTGPLRAVISALRHMPKMEDLDDETIMRNPQSRMIVGDITLEAVVDRLSRSARGLCTFRNELAGWIKSFNAYKKSGGDEQAWLEFWDAQEYQLDRKTNAEELFIPAASVCIIGGIQPKVLVECFDPGKFASGLVPRLLITHPPARIPGWSDVEVKAEMQEEWNRTVMWLRTRPFANLGTNSPMFEPNVLNLSVTAKARFVEYFNEISNELSGMDEIGKTFASKSRVIAARLALIVHMLTMAEVEGIIPDIYTTEISRRSTEAGCQLARWFLNEQLRVYGLASTAYDQQELTELILKIKADFGGVVSVRRLMRSNSRKYKVKKHAKVDLDKLVAAGLGTWDAKQDQFTVKA